MNKLRVIGIAAAAFSLSTQEAIARESADEGGFIEILGGTPAVNEEWPDAAAIVYGDGSYACSGVLIAPDVVLTAAHCLSPDIARVFLNTTDLSNPGEVIEVVGQVAYPNSWQLFDIGLLFLAESSSLEPRIIARGCVADLVSDEAAATIAGWGNLDPWGTGTSELHEADTVIWDAACESTELGCNAAVSPGGELLAGGDGVDGCPGDSGGPLYLKTGFGDFLAGISSRGIPGSASACGDGGIYVRPDAVISWIEDQSGLELPEPDCGATEPSADPTELLAELIEEVRTSVVDRPLLKLRMMWLLRSSYRLLVDDSEENDLVAIERLERFSRLAQRAGLDASLIEKSLQIIELLLESPDDSSLPDLAAGIGPNPECGIYQGMMFPAATQFVLGDLAFTDGDAHGTESFHLFGNEELIARGGFETCVVDYSVSGTVSGSSFTLQAAKDRDSCPEGLGFPAVFDIEYHAEFSEDGSVAISMPDSNWQAEGYWSEGRMVYRSESCEFF